MKNDDEIKAFIEKFEQNHFHAQSLPVDVQKLITYKLKNGLDRVFQTIDVKLREVGDIHPLISHDYINDRDRGNLQTMANVQAMNEISNNMGVIAYGNSGPEGVIGYWPMDSSDCSLFSLDTEGQYHLCLGKTYLETVYFEAVVNDYDKGKAECIELFTELQIPFQIDITADDIWKQVELRKAALDNHPQKERDKRYPIILSEPDKVEGYRPITPKSEVPPITPTLEITQPKPKFWQFWKRK